MKGRGIFLVFWGAVLSSIFVLGGFLVFTFWLGEMYVNITGPLVHSDKSLNRALLYIFSQACALGGAGGYLSVLQILFSIAHSNDDWFSPQTTSPERFLVGFLIPIKGVIAGAMAGGILGGVFFFVGGLEALGKAHLVILGVSCIAGYSEQALQRIVQLGSDHAGTV
jgi:hypothetical protein